MLPRIGWLGIGLWLFFLLMALGADWLAPYDPRVATARPLLPPSSVHWLGTNDVGQDILSEMIVGARVSLLIATITPTLVVGIALVVGVVAGYAGGWLDTVLMRMVDVLLAIPSLPLMILIAVYAGSGLLQLILILSLFAWEIPARLIRNEVLSVRNRMYVHAAQALGCDPFRVIGRHIIPALLPVLITSFANQASRAVFLEASLAFIGIGDPTSKSWGAMMRAATGFRGIWYGSNWIWWILPTAACISLLVLAFSFIGQGLERWANPRLSK